MKYINVDVVEVIRSQNRIYVCRSVLIDDLCTNRMQDSTNCYYPLDKAEEALGYKLEEGRQKYPYPTFKIEKDSDLNTYFYIAFD